MTRTAIILLGIAALMVLWGIGAHNRLVRLRSAVTQAWPAVDVQLSRRHALALEIGALLGTPMAEPAMGDDIGRSALQTLQAAARQAVAAAAHARGRAAAAGAIQSLALAEQVLNGALRPWPVLVSARSSALERAELLVPAQALLLTQHELHTQLRFVRRVFNEAVAAYNGAIDEMPTRLLAGPLGFRPSAAFQVAAPEAEPLAAATDAAA